jgi:hypothetical protein
MPLSELDVASGINQLPQWTYLNPNHGAKKHIYGVMQ